MECFQNSYLSSHSEGCLCFPFLKSELCSGWHSCNAINTSVEPLPRIFFLFRDFTDKKIPCIKETIINIVYRVYLRLFTTFIWTCPFIQLKADPDDWDYAHNWVSKMVMGLSVQTLYCTMHPPAISPIQRPGVKKHLPFTLTKRFTYVWLKVFIY